MSAPYDGHSTFQELCPGLVRLVTVYSQEAGAPRWTDAVFDQWFRDQECNDDPRSHSRG